MSGEQGATPTSEKRPKEHTKEAAPGEHRGRGGRGGRGGGGRRGRGAATNNANQVATEKEDEYGNPVSRGGRGRGNNGGRGWAGRGRGAKQQPQTDESKEAKPPTPTAPNTDKAPRRLPLVKRNTEEFEPSHAPPSMRVVVGAKPDAYGKPITVRDVIYCPSVFSQKGDDDLYARLVKEIENNKVPQERLLKSWHGDSHWIADDTTGWKKSCPAFNSVIERLAAYFKMDVKATRFNWYTDTSEWKPFHHDAAAMKPQYAKTQNFTAAVSFGATRDAAFQHAKSKDVVVSFPQPDGAVYCFARDTNILWRHGILQEKEVKQEGRISVILWGWVDQEECD